MLIRFLLLFTCLHFCYINKAQTCIIIVIHQDTITIGADSKVGYYLDFHTPGRKDSVFSRNQCKIFSTGNIFFTGSGKVMSTVVEYAQRALSKNPHIEDTIPLPIEEINVELAKIIEPYRIENFQEYKRRYYGYFTSVVFLWYEKRVPKMYDVEFHLTNKDNEQTKVEALLQAVNIANVQKGSIKLFKLGHKDAIDDTLCIKTFKEKGIINGVNELIGLQILSTPESVGYPIAILQLTRNGTSYIQKGSCE